MRRWFLLSLVLPFAGCSVQYTETGVHAITAADPDGTEHSATVVVKSTSTPFSGPKTTLQVLDTDTYVETTRP